MNFLYSYILFGVLIPFIIIVLSFSIALVITNHLSKKKSSTPIIILPLICWLLIFLISVFLWSDAFKYPICALVQHNSNRYITAGYVENIEELPAPPVYYDNVSNTLTEGKLITVNGTNYFIPFCNFDVGDAVELTWGTDEKVVYKYSVKAMLSESEIGTRLISNNKAVKKNLVNKNVYQSISWFSFIIFDIIVLIRYFFDKKISNFLIEKDKKITNMIVPNVMGVCIFSLTFVPFLVVLICQIILGFYGVLLILIFIISVWAILIIKKLNIKLIINNDYIIIKEFKKNKVIKKDEVAIVSFVQSRFLRNNRCLVILLNNGEKFEFEQQDFWGLTSIYDILNKSINNTGDGSLC